MEYTDPIDRKIWEIVQLRGKLAAVKFCKDAKGWDLVRSKDYVEQMVASWSVSGNMESSVPQPGVATDTGAIDRRILEILQQHGKITAIKFCKEANGWGLAASKKYVDNLAATNGVKGKTGCFIATACYGDYNAKEVIVLRQYRDEVLMKKRFGRFLVTGYYCISPFIARRVARSGRAQSFIRKYLLAPVINRIIARRKD